MVFLCLLNLLFLFQYPLVAFALLTPSVPAQGCRGDAFFPKSAVFALVLGISVRVWGFSRLHLDSLAVLVVLPFRSVCLYYA